MIFSIVIGLFGVQLLYALFLCILVILPHKKDYVVTPTIAVSTAKVRVFESAFCESHRSPSYKFSSYSRYCAQEYRQGVRCPFASCNKCVQKGGGGYEEKPSFPTRPPLYIVFSYHSKYSIYQADCRFLLQIRHRFLFFVLLYTF